MVGEVIWIFARVVGFGIESMRRGIVGDRVGLFSRRLHLMIKRISRTDLEGSGQERKRWIGAPRGKLAGNGVKT